MKPKLLSATLLSVALLSGPALANQKADWHPPQVERLLTMPAHYLEKTLEREFAKSELGKKLTSTNETLSGQAQTLSDLQAAITKANGQTRIDLQHRFLEEKKAMLERMNERLSLRRQETQTRLSLYETMSDKLFGQGNGTGRQNDLVKAQAKARARFSQATYKMEDVLFERAGVPESKYAVSYAKNMAAIEKLSRKIAAHSMSIGTGDLANLSREDQIMQFIADEQAKLALLDQEEQMIGLMARLVSLDAMALSDDVMIQNDPGGKKAVPVLTVLTDLFMEGEE